MDIKNNILIAGFCLLSVIQAHAQFDYYPLTLGYNFGRDNYKLANGTNFNNSDNFQTLYLTRSHNRGFLLAEMDFIAGWPQQTHYTPTSIDSIFSNNFQLFNTVLAFYGSGEKRIKAGFYFNIDATIRNGTRDVSSSGYGGNSPAIVASPSGIAFGIGVSVLARFGEYMVTNHHIGISAIGNAQNDPNWIARNISYLGNVTYPLSGRFALNGYLNIERLGYIDMQSLQNDHAGTLLHWSLRLGFGMHIGKEKMK